MKDIFSSRIACTVTVTDERGAQETRAFIEPLSAVKPETPEITALGLVDGRRWRVILPPLQLCGEVTLTAAGETYRLLRREMPGTGHHIEALAGKEEGTAC